MIADRKVADRASRLDAFAMDYDTAVLALDAGDCLQAFCDFYGIRDRRARLVPTTPDLRAAMRDLSGERRARPVAEKTLELFGAPKRIAVPDDPRALADRLSRSEGGLGPFYIAFDVMFCEYEGFTLCFMTGSND